MILCGARLGLHSYGALSQLPFVTPTEPEDVPRSASSQSSTSVPARLPIRCNIIFHKFFHMQRGQECRRILRSYIDIPLRTNSTPSGDSTQQRRRTFVHQPDGTGKHCTHTPCLGPAHVTSQCDPERYVCTIRGGQWASMSIGAPVDAP